MNAAPGPARFSRRAIVLFLGLCLIWGFPYLLIKVAVTEIAPAHMSALRALIATAILVPIALWQGVFWPTWKRWRVIFPFALAETVVPSWAIASAEQHISSSLAAVLIATVPLVGVAIAMTQPNRQRLSRMNLVGLFIGLAGVALLVGVDVGGSQPWAIGLMAISVLGYALGPAMLNRWLSQESGVGVMAWTVALSAVFFAPSLVISPMRTVPSARVWVAVFVLGAVCLALAFLMMFALIGEVGPVRATVITYVNPLVAMAAAAVWLDERVTPAMALGAAFIIGGSVVANRSSAAARNRDASPSPGTPAAGIPLSETAR